MSVVASFAAQHSQTLEDFITTLKEQTGHKPSNGDIPNPIKRISGAHILAQDKLAVTSEASNNGDLQHGGNSKPRTSTSTPIVKSSSSRDNHRRDLPILLGSSVSAQPALISDKFPDPSSGRKDRASAQRPITIGNSSAAQRRKPASAGILQPSRIAALSRKYRQPSSIDRETWQTQKDALAAKFGSAGWSPRKRLSPDALEGIRALHRQFPSKYPSPVLANHFEVSVEAIRRILKSKWRPNDDEAADRRQRWDKRGERIWSQMVSLGVKPPKKWREARE
ncbi:MAG: hypothetical protein Q9174_000149 [Haloplaca sp. 1 TL-2023]